LAVKQDTEHYFRENKPFAGLGRASLRSGVTFVAARGANAFIQLASMILLARLLTPHDFGLVAMVLAVTGVAPTIIDLGMGDASTQKTHISHVEISALFWSNIAISVVLTALFAGGSGLIAAFFGEPPLMEISLVLSTTFVTTALSIQHYALMKRAMQFREIAVIDISANVIGSIVSVAIAYAGYGYWALVAKPVATPLLTAAGAWLSCRWVPGRPRFTPAVKEMFAFGLGVTGFTMTDYIARSADRIAIGYFQGAGPLGYFQNAFTIYGNLLAILTEPLHNIAVAGLSKLRGDVDELKRSWAVALSSLSFFSAPAFAVLAVTGQDVLVMLLGQKWAPAGPLLCIFALRGIAHTVERSLGWIHVAAGRADRWMRWGVFSAVCQLVALAAGLPFGVLGVAVAYTIAMFLLFIPAVVYAGRPVGIGAMDVLKVVGPQTVAALVAVGLGFALQEAFLDGVWPTARITASTLICLAVYGIVAVGIFRVTAPLRLAYSLLRDFAPVRLPGGR
jgi:polysaccharide transporter, PST family